MEYIRGRYSWLIRPLLVFFDLFVINFLAFYSFNFNEENLHFFSSAYLNNKHLLYIVYSFLFWMFSTSFISFYSVYRYTSALNILSLLVKQFLIFSILVYAFIGIFRSVNIQAFITFKYLTSSLIEKPLSILLTYFECLFVTIPHLILFFSICYISLEIPSIILV